jgi:hypothetical protein
MKKIISYSAILFFLFSMPVYASVFPNDALTSYANYPASGGTSCYDLLSAVPYPRTLLYATIRTDGANTGTILIDGNTFLTTNKNTEVETFAPMVFTNVAIGCTRDNNKQFSFKITYVDYDLTKTSTTTANTINGLTYGEVLTNFFLFLLIIGLVFGFILRTTIKTKK